MKALVGTFNQEKALEGAFSKYCKKYRETDPVLTLQSPGFAIIIDRRSEAWQWRDIQAAFSKIVAVFPGKIKEVFLLYKYPEGELTNVTYKADM